MTDYTYRPPSDGAAQLMTEITENAGRNSIGAIARLNVQLLLNYAPTLDNTALERMAQTVKNLLSERA